MKFVIAPDSFKGTLSQVEVANVMKNAILKKWPTAEIMMKPMADGGEGTLEALLAASEKSERLTINVTGPLGKRLTTNIGIINNDTVIIEVAVIAGLPLVPKTSRHPYYTTTYGVGEAIIFALNNGYKKFIVGLGGSATNDGGLGMLQALGATMQTKNNKRANIFGKDLFRSEEHTSELQSRGHLVCRLLLEKKQKMARMVGNCRRYSSMLNCARSTEAKGGQCTRLS